MVNSMTARGGGASTKGRDLIGLTQGRRSVFLESSWNARRAVSQEMPFSSSNVIHKHQEAITDQHRNKTPKMRHSRIIPVLVHHSRDLQYAWMRKKRGLILWVSQNCTADGVRGAKHGAILRKPILGSQTKWTSLTLQCSASCSVLGHELNGNTALFWEPCPCYIFA